MTAGITPLFLTSARAVAAALLGSAMVGTMKQKRPDRADVTALATVNLGVAGARRLAGP